MDQREAGIKAPLLRAMRAMRGFGVRRIELKTGDSGFPDMAYRFSGVGVGLIEAKYMYTPGSLAGWEPEQRKFAREWSPEIPVLLYIGDRDCCYLLDTRGVLDLPNFTVRDTLCQWPTRHPNTAVLREALESVHAGY